ncbi:hypothetical protein PMAYCL1PPCAC_05866 [Pristionchus mayeri]|uniref:F-box domain-containing protein n=1 Tax=Pristionchus mayeri TaxID=1317129 RepID=A0AAN4Z7R9_9BILA|nr:hypothetical protein PMAYCL1PPCAC_05866 [Pristionchus mayeri]
MINDLSDDLFLLIIPLLGFIDRSNFSSTCSRFYKLEKDAGISKIAKKWSKIDLDTQQRIRLTFARTNFRHSLLCGSWEIVQKVLSRIVKTLLVCSVSAKVDFHEYKTILIGLWI